MREQTQPRRLRCPHGLRRPAAERGRDERRASSGHGTRGLRRRRGSDPHRAGRAARESRRRTRARGAQRWSTGRRRHDGRRPDALLPPALGAYPRAAAQRHVRPATRPARGDSQTGRQGHADAGHPHGARPIHSASSPASPLTRSSTRPSRTRALAFVRDGARIRRSSVPASTSRRGIDGWWTWTSRNSSTA